MPLRQFNADVTAAAALAAEASSHVTSVRKGDSDGEVIMVYAHENLPSPIRVTLLSQDVDSYPNMSSFFLYTDDDNVPAGLIDAMKELEAFSAGWTVRNMVSALAKTFTKEMQPSSTNRVSRDADDDTEMTDVEPDLGADGHDDDDEYDEYDPFGQDSDEDYEDAGVDELFGLRAAKLPEGNAPVAVELEETAKAMLPRMLQDLRAVQNAGFKVGVLCGMDRTSGTNIFSFSIRANRLGLSEEALQTWDIKMSEYIVLLMRVDGLYRPFEQAITLPVRDTAVKFRIGKCARYKPGINQAFAAFAEASNSRRAKGANNISQSQAEANGSENHAFLKTIVSNSLDPFMTECFVALTRFRETRGICWDRANLCYLDHVGYLHKDRDDHNPVQFSVDDSHSSDRVLPEILRRDHLAEDKPNTRSLPLVAMQFAIRYFVKCTKYCLRCHRRVDDGFEAIKPYVCSNPLCLFQYMAMGYGPSIEHEILKQPKVVDLLVSFCYASLSPNAKGYLANASYSPSFAIREVPAGLQLKVPNLTHLNGPWTSVDNTTDSSATSPILCRMHVAKDKYIVENVRDLGRLMVGQWVAMAESTYMTGSSARVDPASQGVSSNAPQATYGFHVSRAERVRLLHYTVYDIDFAHGTVTLEFKAKSGMMAPPTALQESASRPTLTVPAFNIPQSSRAIPPILPSPALLSSPPQRPSDIASQIVPASQVTSEGHIAVEVCTTYIYPYAADFDEMPDYNKVLAMGHILDTLPAISMIKEYLEAQPHSSLRSVYGVSPAAASLLEWIVASNRSCIFQTESPPAPDPTQASTSAGASAVTDEMIRGMTGWVQFRFAQGSPDKELHFSRELQQVMARKRLVFPTIFAWHGSALGNWHSIVRAGLDYTTTAHGRAYGDGVYFSTDFSTSRGYTSLHGTSGMWPNSDLQINAAISLNEIINAPDEFRSEKPHYVVHQRDWHQCRFLFVKSIQSQQENRLGYAAAATTAVPATQAVVSQSSPMSLVYFHQDPARPVHGPEGQALVIPIASMPSARLRSSGLMLAATQTPGDAAADKDDDQEDDQEDDLDNIELSILHDEKGKGKVVDKGKTLDKGTSYSRNSSVDTVTARQVTTKRPLTPAHITMQVTEFRPFELDLSTVQRLQPPSWATRAGNRALAAEIKKLVETQGKTPPHELGWFIDFGKLDNLYQWIVELHSFDLALPLAQDMKKAGIQSVVCEVRFGAQYPYTPPFVRVIRPRFMLFVSGGGGHVTAGGAMCMELLTNTGWSPVNSMESVLLQVRLAMCSTDPRPARMEVVRRVDYTITEAVDAFTRAASVHGWKVPEDLNQTARQ